MKFLFNDFLLKEWSYLVFQVFALFILSLTVYLFGLSWQSLSLALALILIFDLLFYGRRFLKFKRQADLQAKISQLEEELAQVQEATRLHRLDLEEYFLIWLHQIKTPITAAYLLLDQNQDLDIMEKKALEQELIKIENYTNLVLNYLKVTNPSRDLEVSQVDIYEIITYLIKRYRSQFIQKNIILNLELTADRREDYLVTTDANLTSLMIEQILSNALKYTHKGSITIAYDDEQHILTIADTGIGIQAEDLSKIFYKGYSGHNGQLNKKSSGIGLYLVDLISKRLGQKVMIQSKVGQGNVFTIHFNLTEL